MISPEFNAFVTTHTKEVGNETLRNFPAQRKLSHTAAPFGAVAVTNEMQIRANDLICYYKCVDKSAKKKRRG